MNKSYLQAIYAAWSRVYDSFIDKIFAFDRKRVVESLNVKKGVRVLEVGVGTGLNLKYYPQGASVTGIDFSSAMLSKARKKKAQAKVTLLLCDASRTLFADDSFDKALATYVLRISPDPREILKELSRVTVRGARFVLVDQFSEQKSLLLALVEPIQLILGWGKNYSLRELIKGTPWMLVSKERFGKMKGTTLAVLKNTKVKRQKE